MRFKNADITPGHGHTKFGGWSRLRLLKIKGNPFLEAPYKERKEIVICRENVTRKIVWGDILKNL